MICAECEYWTMGDTWGSSIGKDHGVVVECKGWCLAKPNKRKRWNYCPCNNCKLFKKRKKDGIILYGEGLPTEEQINTIVNFLEERLG